MLPSTDLLWVVADDQVVSEAEIELPTNGPTRNRWSTCEDSDLRRTDDTGTNEGFVGLIPLLFAALTLLTYQGSEHRLEDLALHGPPGAGVQVGEAKGRWLTWTLIGEG
jgi:hypothetical protein